MTPEPTDKDIQQSALFECLRPEIRKMAFQMEEKFRLHDKERGDPFLCDDQEFMEHRLDEEEIEMEKAMGRCGNPDEKKPPSVIWKEAADRCNFILMMAVNYEREWKKGK